MSTLPLFDIQRGSLVDGDGVRTTVFFRGCNLRCAWCHNPESQSGEKRFFYYAEKCVRCGKCNSVCTEKAVSFGRVDYLKCTFCGKCSLLCPQNALKLSGFDISENEVMKIILRDKPFYDQSGGGVTFSGGECMLHYREVASLARRCKAENVNVAVDTAGAVQWESFAEVLPFVDTFLYDVKILDSEKHKKFIGTDNAVILANLTKLLDLGADVIVRIPIIPGINDNEADITAIRDFLSPYAVRRIELLPYHRLGENKYRALGLNPTIFDVPSEQKMSTLKKIIAKRSTS